jgi:hypothetical protein
MIWLVEMGVESIRLDTPSRRDSISAADPVRPVRYMNSTSWLDAPRSNWPRFAPKTSSPIVPVETSTSERDGSISVALWRASSNAMPADSAVKRAARTVEACSETTASTVARSRGPTPSGRATNPISTSSPARSRAS